MKISTLYLLLFIFLFGCTTKGQYVGFQQKERNFDTVIELQVLDSMKIEDAFSLQGWKINANNISFITYKVTDNFLSVYSYPNCRKLYGYGKIGQGPDEFVSAFSGDAVSEDVLLYDLMSRKLVQLTIGEDSLWISKKLPLYNGEDGVCKLFTFISQIEGDKYLMKIDEYESSSWEIADLGKNEILDSYKNPIRKAEASYTPFDFVQCIYDSTFIVAYKYMDRIELYSIVNDKIKPMVVLGSDKDQAELESYNDLLHYYVAVASYEGLFYCLKSRNGENFGNIVEVYDCHGECRVKYTLGKIVDSINIDTEGCLVGYVSDVDETIIYRFKQ